MLIDCDTCEVRGHACGDCVVTFLLGSAPGAEGTTGQGAGVELDTDEQEALRVLADSGLVPPLRLVPRSQAVTLSARRSADGDTEGDTERPNRHGMKSAG